jgi:photosystem II stability/assembly factor-like uncharacterized protein
MRHSWLLALLVMLTACAPAAAQGVQRSRMPIVPRGVELDPVALAWSWQNPRSHGNTLMSVSFTPGGVGWAVGDGGKIQRSDDGGQTWAQQSSGTTRILRRVAAVSPSVAWAAGEGGVVLRTTDGGERWIEIGTGVTDDLTGLAAPSASVAWVVGGRNILKTNDAGAMWVAQAIVTGNRLHGLALASRGVVWAVGDSGMILSGRG